MNLDYINIQDQFYGKAKEMRRAFDATFRNPHQAKAERFCWDYWHIPDQYTLLRTPAYQFFPKKIYEPFHRHLVRWGRENLGCHDISPTWLSCYVEGCKQEIHRDLPHGPLAFVYSLTPWASRKFLGGETFLLSPSGKALERNELLKTIPAKFNRLTLFDPAIPHGVTEVRGVHSPLEGRLVIHGWFVQPRPFLLGSLKPQQVQKVLDNQLSDLLDRDLADEPVSGGFASFKLEILKSGRVKSVKSLVDTARVSQVLKKSLLQLQFASSRGPTKLTLPIQFN